MPLIIKIANKAKKAVVEEPVNMEFESSSSSSSPPLSSRPVRAFSTGSILTGFSPALSGLMRVPSISTDLMRVPSTSTESDYDQMECGDFSPVLTESEYREKQLKKHLKESDEKLKSSISDLELALRQMENFNKEIAQHHLRILQSRVMSKHMWVRKIVYRNMALNLQPFSVMDSDEGKFSGAEFSIVPDSELLNLVHEPDAFEDNVSTNRDEEFAEQKSSVKKQKLSSQVSPKTKAAKRIDNLYSSHHRTRPHQASARALGINGNNVGTILNISDQLDIHPDLHSLKSAYFDKCVTRHNYFSTYWSQAHLNYFASKDENALLAAKSRKFTAVPVLPPPPGFSPRNFHNNTAPAVLRCSSPRPRSSLFSSSATAPTASPSGLPSRCSTPPLPEWAGSRLS